ncbi:hypothetical protein [Streptomyces baarnensis]|uniref:hypothetical protein n=1 Tax=Streptomyces baarnensis TaxID=66872 RepID=UPI001319FF63|nr:hypothetical protein [Streptomyces baarnensis]
MTASAQVEAALAGVREQARQEQGVALRAARRAAYGEFLGQIEMVRMALDRALDVSKQAAEATDYYRTTHLPPSPTPSWAATRARMEDSVDALWFRHSALRLYADDQIVDAAERLIRTARAAADIFHLVTEAVNEEYDPAPYYVSIQEKVTDLKIGTSAWADAAAASLDQPIL